MNNKPCPIGEQEIIDYLLGYTQIRDKENLEQHFSICPSCQGRIAEWQQNLPSLSNTLPPPALKRKLKTKFLLRSKFYSLHSKKIAFTAAALFLLLISGIMIKGLFISPKEEMKKEMAFVMDPKTVQYQVKPKEHRNVKGYVWVNPESNELLLLVNGIQPVSEKDYQVWIVYNRERSNGGLMQWRNGMGLLYVQPPNVTQIQNIAVTVEPKGGSHLPTAPDAMFVDLKEQPMNRIY